MLTYAINIFIAVLKVSHIFEPTVRIGTFELTFELMDRFPCNLCEHHATRDHLTSVHKFLS
jgi:hypothetical protein